MKGHKNGQDARASVWDLHLFGRCSGAGTSLPGASDRAWAHRPTHRHGADAAPLAPRRGVGQRGGLHGVALRARRRAAERAPGGGRAEVGLRRRRQVQQPLLAGRGRRQRQPLHHGTATMHATMRRRARIAPQLGERRQKERHESRGEGRRAGAWWRPRAHSLEGVGGRGGGLEAGAIGEHVHDGGDEVLDELGAVVHRVKVAVPDRMALDPHPDAQGFQVQPSRTWRSISDPA